MHPTVPHLQISSDTTSILKITSTKDIPSNTQSGVTPGDQSEQKLKNKSHYENKCSAFKIQIQTRLNRT